MGGYVSLTPTRPGEDAMRQPVNGQRETVHRWRRGLIVVVSVEIAMAPWTISTPVYLQASRSDEPAIKFTNVAAAAGLAAKTIFGQEGTNTYLVETTGCGVAWLDYDRDGWLDLFLVNGSRLEGFPAGREPTNHLYRNNRDGTFTDVTAQAGLVRSGWGQGVCVGDYDNDGFDDLYVTYWGFNVLYRNTGDGTFTDVSEKAGVAGSRRRWNTGCAFLDYDRDGHLDLFAANYIDFDPKTAPRPETGPCLYKGVPVACGPPGLPGAKNILYRNNGNGTFTDVSEKAGITRTNGTYGLGVLTGDFDNDGWVDIYVANDSAPAALYRNNRDGTFTDVAVESGCAYSLDGKPQAGMGVAAGDYDRDGWLDIFKTNFADDTSNLYRNLGKGVFEDVVYPSGIGANTLWLGWGCGSSTWTIMAGWIFSSVTDMSIPKWTASKETSATANRKFSIATSRTGGSRTSRRVWEDPLWSLRRVEDAPLATMITMATLMWPSIR